MDVMNGRGNKRTSSVLVLVDRADDDGSTWRAVVWFHDGTLAIQGYDTTTVVPGGEPVAVHEFARTLDADQTEQLRALLGAVDGDLLVAIERRFRTTDALEAYLDEVGLTGTRTDGSA